MEMSEKIDLISAAISKFQSQVTTAKKTSENPYFKSNYADLAEIWDTIKNPLCVNGLAVVQSPEHNDGKVIITTLITHNSGQWIKGSFAMQPVKTDPQSYGSCVTYGRRYSIGAFLGIATELDDDGNKASDLKTDQSKTHEVKNKTSAPATKSETKNAEPAKTSEPSSASPKSADSTLPAAWGISKITKVLSPELKDLFSARQATAKTIVNYFTTFDGDQEAIIKAMREEA